MSATVCPPPKEARPAALLNRPAWRLVLLLAWPVLLHNWLVIAVNFTDRWLAGTQQTADSQQVATQSAQTSANYLAWMLISYTTLVTVGSTALVARLIGAGDRHGARQVLHQSLLLALILGVFGAVVGLFLVEPALALLQLRGPAAHYAAAYLRPLLIVLPLQMAGAAGIACLAAAGDTRTGLWVLGGVAVLNLPLAALSFHWLGFVGIAVGTAVTQAIGGVAVLAVLLRGRAGLRLRPRHLRPRWELLARLLRVSVPAAIDNLSMQAGHLWFLSIINCLGDIAGAAHGTALMWEALGYQSGAAFGTAAMTVVGQYLGAGQSRRAAHGAWVAFGLGVLVMSLMGAIFFTLAGPMFHVFNPNPDQVPIIAAGVPALRLVAFGMPALASCLVLGRALQGGGDTRVPVLFTWFGFFVVRIPLAYWLTWPAPHGFDLGLLGAWLAMFADLQVRGLCLLWRFLGGRWQSIRV